MTKNEAINLLNELENSPNMKKHALSVGFVMSDLFDYFKNRNKNPQLDKESWEITGLLHDADYEITGKSLDLHTDETTKKLKKIGADQTIIEAIQGHCDKAERNTLLAKSVYACDELTGLIVAAALVQPDKKLKSLTVASVIRKFKDKSFAKGANRDQMKTCEKELEIPLEEFIDINLKSMQNNSGDLGL